MSFFGTDETDALEAKVDELERQLLDEQRQHGRTRDELNFHKGLKYDHATNVEREAALEKREDELALKQETIAAEAKHQAAQAAADLQAQKDVFEAQVKARTAELDGREANLTRSADELDERSEELDEREGSINDSNYEKGYAAGYKSGIEQLNGYRAEDRKHYGEILKLHAIGQFAPKTVKEGDKDPMSEAYGELGAKLIAKVMDGDKDSAKSAKK